MKPSALSRLAEYARGNTAFVKLFQENRRAALREAANAGIRLSPTESKLLRKVLSRERVSLTVDELAIISSLDVRLPGGRKAKRPAFWPIFCVLLLNWKHGARRRFAKSRRAAPKVRKS